MKLLVVEDDAKIAGRAAAGPDRGGLLRSRWRQDGLDGLWRAREGSYDLILLDVMLPGRNGYRVCADLRRAGDTTPILMLTAKDGDLDEAEGLDTGADDYLRKPFSFPVLVARVHALLRRAALGEPPPLAVGDLRLDLRGRRVHRGGTEVPLTAREFDLLVYLVRRAGPWCPSSGSSPGSGTTSSRAIRTWSRCTWPGCGASSTSRSAGAASRPSAAPATASARHDRRVACTGASSRRPCAPG